MYVLAAVVKLDFGVLASNPVSGDMDSGFEGLPRANLGLAQLRFELAPGRLNRRKVGRVRRQKQHLDAAPGQFLQQPFKLVPRQVIRGPALRRGAIVGPTCGPCRKRSGAYLRLRQIVCWAVSPRKPSAPINISVWPRLSGTAPVSRWLCSAGP